MDFRSLRYFETVARLGSFTRAAAELHVAQPALSVAVKKLEGELGVLVFTRTPNRPLTLTPEGVILLRRAERLFQEMDSARRELADTTQLRSGEVKIGMPPIYGPSLFAPLMASFHAAHPGIQVSATLGSAGEVGRLLDAGEIDLAVLESRRVRDGWGHATIGEEEMVLCVARGHPLARQGRIRDKDLADFPMATFDTSFLQRNVLDRRCKKAGVQYRKVLETNYVPLATDAAASGLGAVTLLRSVAAADPRLAALSFDPPELFRFELCWLDERYLSRANRVFMEMALRREPSPTRARSRVSKGVKTG